MRLRLVETQQRIGQIPFLSVKIPYRSDHAVAIGSNTTAKGVQSVGVGSYTKAEANLTVAVGPYAQMLNKEVQLLWVLMRGANQILLH